MNNKNLAIVLILTMAISSLSLLMTKPANAQSIPKPYVPSFTVKYIESSYNVSTTDPNTGKTVYATLGNSSIEFVINNQSFKSYVDSNGNTINLYYNVSSKEHFTNTWSYNDIGGGFPASKADYTTLHIFHPMFVNSSQEDFRVEAQVGYYTTGYYYINGFKVPNSTFIGQTSDWSLAQTLTIPASSVSPNSSPTVPEFSWLAILPLFVAMTSVAVLLRHRKTAK
jgi:hypothetical protein